MSQTAGYLLDTNIISEIGKGQHCDQRVAGWFERLDDSELHLSVLVIGEVRKGIESLRPRDAARAAGIEAWLGQIERAFAGRILPINTLVADLWGRLAARRTLPVIDSLLAATALAHGLVLATRNVDDLIDSGARMLNPFEER